MWSAHQSMSIWFEQTTPSAAQLNTARAGRKTVLDTLDISVTEVGEDYLRLSMPVDSRHTQPLGLLHGGVSVVLAESAASIAANLCLDNRKQYAVGVEINANHLRSVQEGEGSITATAIPVHIGKTSHVWRVAIIDQHGRAICESRMTARVLDFQR